MAGYSLVIDDSITLDAFKFDWQPGALPTDNSLIEKQEIFIEASGVITGDTPQDVLDRASELAAAVENQATPQRVEIFLDGASWREYDPSTCINSPIVTRFQLLSDEDGSGESYWKWTMSIYVQLSGRGDGTTGLRTSLEIVKENGQVTRKAWKAEATADSADSAEAVIRRFQPAETIIKEDVEKFFQESRATGLWLWEARVSGGVISIDERTEVTGQGAGYEFDRQVNDAGTAEPVLHRKPLGGITITIKGTIRALRPGNEAVTIELPSPHYKESPTCVRDFEAEATWPDALPDGDEGIKHGIYRRDYMEVWKCTHDPGGANHEGHQVLTLITPPADGTISAAN